MNIMSMSCITLVVVASLFLSVIPRASSSYPLPHFHFILVHGFGSGAWSWFKLRARLEHSSFKVTCLDLKAAGMDPSPVGSVQSLDDYNENLVRFFSNYSTEYPNEKVILVGHSAGGVSVTDITYKFPAKVHVAIYLAATMLRHGFRTKQDLTDGVPGLFNRTNSQPGQASTTLPDKDKIFNTSPMEDFLLATMLQREGPLQAIVSAKFSGSKADEVPRVYIRTLQDRVLVEEQQKSMIRRWPPARVYEIDTDHCPNFSDPSLLAGLLVQVAFEF